MALINTLRNKMGKVVVAAVAIAILSFTLNDILGQNSVLFGSDNSVGEIAGEEISLEEFRNVLAFQEQNFSVFAGRQPTENDRYMINERAWLWLKTQYAFGPQYQKVGIEVGDDELLDMLQGTNIDPTIRAMFTNQQTGEFDRIQFNNFYSRRNIANSNESFYWNAIFPTLKPSRERMKYENLMVKTEFATQAEGSIRYHEQSDVAEAKYLFIPFYSVPQADVDGDITDEKLRAYYNKNKAKYKGEMQRSMEFVVFPIVASAQDTLDLLTEMEEIKKEFSEITDDEVYANSNSDGTTPFGRYHRGNIPYQLAGDLESLTIGEVRGPLVEGNKYTLFKVSDIYEDTLSYARASHILIPWDDETDEKKAEARTKALDILNQLKGGANFAALARQHGTDASAQSGGDLGWFDSETMVDEFATPVFNATSTGLIPNLVETQFGYHIVEVTENKTNTIYAIASIERELGPSNETRDVAYRKADLFKSNSNNYSSFTANAETDGLEVQKAENVNPMDRSIATLGSRSRAIVQWLFTDAEVGDVSELYELDDKYVVAAMTREIKKGIRPFDAVKDDVRAKVTLELKEDLIRSKLGDPTGTLEEIASSYGEDAKVYSVADLKLESNSLSNVGFDPVAVGRIFSLDAGQRSEIFATDNGVFIADLINITVAPEVADYSSFTSAIQATRTNSASIKITNVIDDKAEVEDHRYRVY